MLPAIVTGVECTPNARAATDRLAADAKMCQTRPARRRSTAAPVSSRSGMSVLSDDGWHQRNPATLSASRK